MSSTPNTKASSSKKAKAFIKGNVIDFESLSLPSLKKYRSQFQIRIKPSVPKSELAAAIAEHFASIPIPEETEVIGQFFKALQKNRNSQSETEDSTDEQQQFTPVTAVPKKSLAEIKRKLNGHNNNTISNNSNNSGESATETDLPKNSSQSNSKRNAKRNSISKVEKSQSSR